MSGQWEPGTVAMVRFVSGDREVPSLRDTHGWAHIRDYDTKLDSHSIWTSADQAETVRPLVVIDPEDREQVERLAKSMHESDHIAPWHDLHNETRKQIEDAMQSALREFANPTPPKPDEPQGLGAVVEDAVGMKWTRANDEGEWFSADGREVALGYAEVSAVRVLSEGVTP